MIIMRVFVGAVVAAVIGGCSLVEDFFSSGSVRRSGQVELFTVDETGNLHASLSDNDLPERRATLFGEFGEPIRFIDDVVTLQVHGGFLQTRPKTLTGSRDIVLFAEVWENAASGYNSESINTIVYVAQNQVIPGRMNFDGNLAYGPTNFKGHPMRIKFTLMVLQSRRGEQVNSAAQVLQNLTSISGSGSLLGPMASEAVGIVRQVLRSQPDVEAFDFEITFLSDRPEDLADTLIGAKSNAPRPGSVSKFAGAEDDESDGAENVERAALGDLPVRVGKDVGHLLKQLDAVRAGPKVDASQRAAGLIQQIESSWWAIDYFDRKYLLPTAKAAPEGEGFSPARLMTSRILINDLKISALKRDFIEHERELMEMSKDPAALERFRQAVFNIESRVDEAERLVFQTSALAIPSVDPSRWRSKFNWLRYGTYALVESRPVRFSTHAHKLEHGWQCKSYLDGQWLMYSERKGEPKQPLRANYLVFSITPGQLRQDIRVLREASGLSDRLLRELRDSDAKSVMEHSEAVFQTFRSAVHRVELEWAAERILRALVEGNEKGVNLRFSQDFDLAVDAYIQRLYRGGDKEHKERLASGGDENLRIREIGREISERWLRRIKALVVQGAQSVEERRN